MILMRSEIALRTTNTSVTVSDDTRDVSRCTPATQIICVRVLRISGIYPLGSETGVGHPCLKVDSLVKACVLLCAKVVMTWEGEGMINWVVELALRTTSCDTRSFRRK